MDLSRVSGEMRSYYTDICRPACFVHGRIDVKMMLGLNAANLLEVNYDNKLEDALKSFEQAVMFCKQFI